MFSSGTYLFIYICCIVGGQGVGRFDIIGKEILEDQISGWIGAGAGALAGWLYGPEVGVAVGLGVTVLVELLIGGFDLDDLGNDLSWRVDDLADWW